MTDLLALLVENAPDIIIGFDRDLQVVYMNALAQEGLGRFSQQPLGQHVSGLGFSAKDAAAFASAAAQAFASGAATVATIVAPDEAGAPVHFQLRLAPEFDHCGEPKSLLCIARDITALTRAQEELRLLNASLEAKVAERTAALRAANVELAQALHAKDEFLAAVSHELRTPLSGILALTEALQLDVCGSLTPNQAKMLHRIDENGRRLLELINEVLDMAKLGADKLALAVSATSVSDVCQASLRLVADPVQQKGQHLAFSMQPGPIVMFVDSRRLKQMLVNLLDNAVKFTPAQGKIGLTVEGDEAAGVVRFTIWDTGIGIAEADLPRLFEPFVQLDSGLARRFSGTGLGLALVARIAALHGGSVQVESDPGKGSRFTIILPWRTDRSLPSVDPP